MLAEYVINPILGRLLGTSLDRLMGISSSLEDLQEQPEDSQEQLEALQKQRTYLLEEIHNLEKTPKHEPKGTRKARQTLLAEKRENYQHVIEQIKILEKITAAEKLAATEQEIRSELDKEPSIRADITTTEQMVYSSLSLIAIADRERIETATALARIEKEKELDSILEHVLDGLEPETQVTSHIIVPIATAEVAVEPPSVPPSQEQIIEANKIAQQAANIPLPPEDEAAATAITPIAPIVTAEVPYVERPPYMSLSREQITEASKIAQEAANIPLPSEDEAATAEPAADRPITPVPQKKRNYIPYIIAGSVVVAAVVIAGGVIAVYFFVPGAAPVMTAAAIAAGAQIKAAALIASHWIINAAHTIMAFGLNHALPWLTGLVFKIGEFFLGLVGVNAAAHTTAAYVTGVVTPTVLTTAAVAVVKVIYDFVQDRPNHANSDADSNPDSDSDLGSDAPEAPRP
ncbi:MAG: hypothetical protein KBD64_00535 [Gammaproteobacteria bacterium]|nr:hypothetical protein [Gammaproteobacteria bacterium]